MLAPSMALALAYAQASVAALRCPNFAPDKIVYAFIRVHLRLSFLFPIGIQMLKANPGHVPLDGSQFLDAGDRLVHVFFPDALRQDDDQIGRASCRERV